MCLKSPNWNDRNDRELYYKMFYSKDAKPLKEYSEDEQNFIKAMYHAEEFACGLDG